MSKTEHYQLQKPEESKTVEQEIRNWYTLLDQLDAIIYALRKDVDNKSATGHLHKVDEVDGLTNALNNKMPADKTFALSDLTDVISVDDAPLGYILVKAAQGWLAQAASAALGEHKHNIVDIKNLNEALATFVRFDESQNLKDEQKLLARTNIGATKQGLELNNVANKSEAQMVASGPIASALGGKLPSNGTAANSEKLGGSTIAGLWTAMGATQNFGGNGYVKLPNGLILQWGRNSLPADTQTALPIKFPNTCLVKLATSEIEYYSSMTIVVTVEEVNNPYTIITRQRTIYQGGAVGPPGVNQIINWIAIGW